MVPRLLKKSKRKKKRRRKKPKPLLEAVVSSVTTMARAIIKQQTNNKRTPLIIKTCRAFVAWETINKIPFEETKRLDTRTPIDVYQALSSVVF